MHNSTPIEKRHFLHIWIFSIIFYHSIKNVQCCDWEMQNVKEKFQKSPGVLVAQFRALTPNETNPRVMSIAEFRIKKILKGINGTIKNVKLPLYNGHAEFSKQTWCLSHRMLRPNGMYALFLKEENGGKWTNLYMPDEWNQQVQRSLRSNDRVRIGGDNVDLTAKKAEVDPNTGAHLRCTVKGRAADQPGLSWHYDHSELKTDGDGVRVETDNQRLISDLKLSSKQVSKGGVYECHATRKADGKIYKSRLRLSPKSSSSNQTIFGEVFCGPEKDGFCQHGGTCLFQPGTGAFSCRCSNEHTGPRCEYLISDLHVITTTTQVAPVLEPTQKLTRNMLMVGGAAAFVIVALVIGFMLYIKKREQIKSRFNRLSSRLRRAEYSLAGNGESMIDNENRLIDQMTEFDRSISPRRSDQAASNIHIRMIKSLKDARCPHCYRTLGVTIRDFVDSIKEYPRVRHSTPQLSCLDEPMRNGTNRLSQCRECLSVHKNLSTPDNLEIDTQEDRAKTKRERHGGVSDEEAIVSIHNFKKSVSSPVSPSASLCQLHSAQLRSNAKMAGTKELEKIESIRSDNGDQML